MRRADKVIISCAVTGSIHTPSMSPHLPVTRTRSPTRRWVRWRRAPPSFTACTGAETGKPTQDTAVYRQFLPRIAERCDGIVNITTGAGLGMSMDERLAAANGPSPRSPR